MIYALEIVGYVIAGIVIGGALVIAAIKYAVEQAVGKGLGW